ncbi:unnamed protein product [Leuciscus chuanchicus]
MLHIYHKDKVAHAEKGKSNSESAVGSSLVAVQTSGLTGAGEQDFKLAIVPVKVKSKSGQRIVETYAFLDQGSSASFCTMGLMDRLNLSGRKTKILLRTMGQERIVDSCIVSDLEVAGLDSGWYCEMPDIFSQPRMPVNRSNIPRQDDLAKWPHLKHVYLPEIDTDVELLIGMNVPRALEPLEIIRSVDEGPYAIKTMLGWTVNGPLGGECCDGPDMYQSAFTINRISAVTLDELWKQQFKTDFPECSQEEQLGLSRDDCRFLEMVNNTVKLVNGHYSIALPLKDRKISMPNNRKIAEQRTLNLKRRFIRDSSLHKDYTAFMNNLISSGYAEIVPTTDLERSDGKVWYIPHHGVYHPKKEKIRVVFDCAASFQGASLNTQLLNGPDLTSTLIGVLTRFRKEPIVLMSDIEAMFHQVQVPGEDADLLRFLWWSSGDFSQCLAEYRMVVHLFGATSSPSCANFALRRCAEDNEEFFSQQVIDTIMNGFYVDDCLASVALEQEAISLYKGLKAICAKGGFLLTKWVSNSRSVLASIPEEERAKEVKDLDLDHDSLPIERALGVRWCVQSDTFKFSITIQERPLTRRGILSTVSSFYDPLGILAPVVFTAKRILQGLCRSRLGWDDFIPLAVAQEWIDWLKELHQLEGFSIRRCLKPLNFGKAATARLHHFADASEEGYGAVTYLLLRNEQSQMHSAFIMGKSRVAPLKPVTIPRMELIAAVVAARMDKLWRKELRLQLQDSVFWTDSTSVLKYIKNETSRFRIFVANRVSEILKVSDASQWRFVNTAHNPADLASRGARAEPFLNNETWISGPSFLLQSEEDWPVNPDELQELPPGDPEVKVSAAIEVSAIRDENDAITCLINRTSSWTRLTRVMGWVLRFKVLLLNLRKMKEITVCLTRSASNATQQKDALTKDMCDFKNKFCGGYLSMGEIREAEIEIIMFCQRRRFSEEFSCLRKGEGVKRNSHVYKLNPILEDGVLRVGGRLSKAAMPEESKHPAILAKDLHISDLILQHIHQEVGHGGRNHMLSRLRQRYWIPGVSGSIRRILARCVVCRRLHGAAGQQQMADLPEDRVSSEEPPFSHVGVDYFGPFEVKRGEGTLASVDSQVAFKVSFLVETLATLLAGCFRKHKVLRLREPPSTGDGRLTFHQFPVNDPERLKLWLLAVRWDVKTPMAKIERSRLCSEHFSCEDYEPEKGKPRRLLKSSAVPVLFQPNEVKRSFGFKQAGITPVETSTSSGNNTEEMEFIREENEEDMSDPQSCKIKNEDTEEQREVIEVKVEGQELNDVEEKHQYHRPHSFKTGQMGNYFAYTAAMDPQPKPLKGTLILHRFTSFTLDDYHLALYWLPDPPSPPGSSNSLALPWCPVPPAALGSPALPVLLGYVWARVICHTMTLAHLALP